jgi:hypothetical protein
MKPTQSLFFRAGLCADILEMNATDIRQTFVATVQN